MFNACVMVSNAALEAFPTYARLVLRAVEANVRSLRNYVNEFKKSKNAVEEFEILSEVITGSFAGFHNDVLALKHIFPPKPTADLAGKGEMGLQQTQGPRRGETAERARSQPQHSTLNYRRVCCSQLLPDRH